ncbi:MAG TPA: DUF2029 domain-containing protein [Myxococcales bacterium]|nr:DUF2029 domain-containing protein [Myxococcales bacterium]
MAGSSQDPLGAHGVPIVGARPTMNNTHTKGVWLVALALSVTFSATIYSQYEAHSFLHGDGAFYANINKSIANDLSLDQTRYHPHSWLEDKLNWNRNIDVAWSNVSLGKDGRWLPKHSYVVAIFSTPFYIAFGLNGLLLFHVLMLVAMLTAAFAIASRFVSPMAAALSTAIVAVQPVIYGGTYAYNNDAFYGALLVVGVWALLNKRLVTAGVLMGVGVWTKATNIVFVFPFAVWLIWQYRKDWRSIARATAAFAIPIVLMLAANGYYFGSPFTTAYHQIIVRTDHQITTQSLAESFNEPVVDGIKRVINHKREGLDSQAPLLWLCVPGLLLLGWRRDSRHLAFLFAVAFGAFLILQARYAFTYARFFMPIVALSVVPIGALLERLDPRQSEDTTTPSRMRPVGLAALTLALLYVLVAWLWPASTYPFSLTEHIEDAKVTNNGQRCDYFNNNHLKWECSGDKQPYAYWGKAIRENECVFNDEQREMLWLHPVPNGQE